MTEQLENGQRQQGSWRQQFWAPGYDRHWWLPPVLATVLALPPGAAGGFLAAFDGMLFDSCFDGCSALSRYVYSIWALAALPVLPYVVCWTLPRRRTLRWLRWTLFAACLACVAGLWAAMAFWPAPLSQ